MIVYHGENSALSRKVLIEKISQFDGEVIRLTGKKLDLAELKQALESHSLFGQEKMVVIEGLFSRQQSKEKKTLLDYCKKEDFPNLIVWEPKSIDGRTLGSFKTAAVQKFVIPAVLFKFLDAISPKNKKNTLLLLHECLKNEAAELVFFMLCRRVKNLIIALDMGEGGLDRMAPWQKGKLVYQAKNFTLKKLLELYSQLLEIDENQKTGKLSMGLKTQLDLLIADL